MDRKKHEIISIGVLIVTLLVLFSLISFHQADQTIFNASAVKHPPDNWVGYLGSHIAWVLLFFLGLGAYGIPAAGLWLSWSLFRGISPFPHGRIQGVGIVLLVLSISSLAAIHLPRMRFLHQEILTGGQIGNILGRFFVKELHSVGSHILLIGIFLIAFVLATPFTLRSSFTWIGSCLLSAAKAFCALCMKGPSMIIRLRRQKTQEENDMNGIEATPTEPSAEQLPEATESLPPVKVEVLAPPVPVARKKIRKEAPALEAPPTRISDEQIDSSGHPVGHYMLPSIELLDAYETENHQPDWKKLEDNSRVLEEKLSDFGVHGKVVAILPGPVITMFEYTPAPGIKISRIVGLSDDLSMALKAISIRVVAPIPGKAAIGIEIPNLRRELVSIRAVLESEAFTGASFFLTIALGQDITGQPIVANLAKMPHLLIAGATGTGKSVCINAVLSSLLFRNTPAELRLLLVDPKRIELSSYEGIPHLIHPVVTDAKMATRALRWAVEEMEQRYRLLADKNVRNIESYNKALAREKQKIQDTDGAEKDVADDDSQLQHHHLPYIVIIIDELADLMMVASREVEESITRLAQMARAAGLHLILATQRPSVDVLTGIIKANIPTRISFQVSSRIDSRTILDGSGAESLLGSGDMLFLPPGTAKLQRIHGAYVSDAEVLRLTEYWKAQQLAEDPLRERVNFQDQSSSDQVAEEELDEKYEEAVELVLETRQASISMLQRRLRVGYNRAARMIEMMEQQGLVSASDGVKPREVLGKKN